MCVNKKQKSGTSWFNRTHRFKTRNYSNLKSKLQRERKQGRWQRCASLQLQIQYIELKEENKLWPICEIVYNPGHLGVIRLYRSELRLSRSGRMVFKALKKSKITTLTELPNPSPAGIPSSSWWHFVRIGLISAHRTSAYITAMWIPLERRLWCRMRHSSLSKKPLVVFLSVPTLWEVSQSRGTLVGLEETLKRCWGNYLLTGTSF